MDLILLRHGKAEDYHPDGDRARALVDKGRRQAQHAANLLAQAGCLPDIVLTSPLVRARQTAGEFCETAGIPGPIIQDWLACGFAPETALSELTAFTASKGVMIVGHEPDFSLLIEHVLGVSGGSIDVKKGSLACVRLHPPSRRATLRFLIPPKLAAEPDF
ncbi:MAG: SixA phosphatase family protein [Verrucomicrobiales bacterium]|nr:histidine phosphatase family protein [Verrucomicrobiota bacterium JB025]